jgi:hypothetical protein
MACSRVSTIPRVLALACLLDPALAHGGQYRGPGEVVPPSNSSGSSATKSQPGSGGSGNSGATGTPSGPATPTSGSGAPSSGSIAGGKARGIAIDDDLGRWEFWWEFGKDPLLRLRDAIYAASRTPEDDLLGARRALHARVAVQRPTDDDLDKVAQALARRLTTTTSRDVVSGCTVALAKIGRDSPDWRLLDLFSPLLASNDQERRETAALAIGIAGKPNAAESEALHGLVLDDARGRRLSGGAAVNERTRAFAAFGLGLLLARATDPAMARGVSAPLLQVLESPDDHGRELRVAAAEALSLLPRSLPGPAGKLLRRRIVQSLGDWYLRDLGPGERLLQAHVPPAIARLLPADDPTTPYWRDLFQADLRSSLDAVPGAGQATRSSNLFIAQSCALALGGLCTAWDAADSPDAAAAELLLACHRSHRDQQTRSFALLALARIGGARARDALLREFDRAGKAIEQPWCAMALGVLAARQRETAAAAGGDEHDDVLANLLATAFAEARNPSAIGALAVALGLAGHVEAVDAMTKVLLDNVQRDDIAGYVALGLGLLRDVRAVPDLRSTMAASARRPFVLMQCVRALGLIGDQSVNDLLCAELAAASGNLLRLAAAAQALGQIGDRRSIEPLLRMLEDDKLGELTTAFVAVALGSICDKDPLPWNSAFATHTNYRAATTTLTNGQSGILDIL